MASDGPTAISYSIELDENKKLYRLLLQLPAEPLWRTLSAYYQNDKAQKTPNDALTLYPDPQMIKDIYGAIADAEQKGFKSRD
ncbi:MAG: hypothetical protein HYU39_09030 [Thaumarchaeota archaeon]|nr:hypothetical protein [Nitrososphaerota archaeon]